MAAGGRNVRLEEEDVRFRRTASGTLKSEGLVGQFSSKHGIVPIFEGGDSHESKRDSATMKIQHVTRLSDGETRFPKLEECAHFHYDFVELGQLQLQLCEDSEDNYRHCVNEQQDYQFLLRVMSKDKMWNIRRSYENFCMLDKQLHKCIFDRRFSHLPELLDNREMEDIGDEALQELLQTYLERFSAIAGSMIYCGSILNWLEMDNRGNRLLAVDDSGINTPAIAAAHAIRRYTAQAADEISLEVGDIVSVIDMPPAEDTMWWRGKRGFEVGFFPSECVEVIGDKVPHSMASRIPPPSRKPFLRKHSKLISFLQRFFFTRPARNQLKRSGIVKERVFGCDLGEHLLNSGHDVPLVLKCCAEVIQKHGIIDGIYRLSGINSNIQKLRLAFDEDRVPDLTDECYLQDIHSISSLLKMYFRELPNPLLTYQLYDKFAEAVQDEDNKLLRIHDVVQQLPPPHYRTTEYLIRHLARVAAHGHDTGMHSKNLAIVWAPNLLRSKELELGGGVAALQGVSIQAVVTEFLICYADLIFSDKMPSYSSPELRQSQKKPRPKSLAISTPTRLLTLEEARERALASNVPQQRYIDVGGGPEKLPPKYHTVLDLPGYRKKSRDSAIGGASTVKSKKSPVSGWKSFFSKSRSSSIKQKGRKSSFQDPVNLGPMERKAITEEDVKHWKKRRLRSAKSAESLLSLASSHKNSISSTSSSARTSKSGEPGMVVNLYSEKSRKTQHKRSLSSDATTSFVHSKDIIPLYDRTNSEAKELPVDVGTEENNYDGRNGESVDENDVPQLGDSRAQMRQSFIRGDTTRRAIQHRKTASAPSTPMQMNREAERKDREASQEEMRKAVPTESESGRHRLVERVVKSVEFVEPVVTVQEPSRMVSRSEESLVSKLSDNQKSGEEEAMSGDIKAIQSVDAKDGEKSLELRRKQYLESKPQPSETSAEVLKWRAYYSRYHDYAEIDESEVAASDIEVNKKELEILAAAGPEENHSPEKDMKVVAAEVRSPILTSTLWSDIAKLEDGISPLSYLQSEMSKCLSVPSDIGKSLENVNIGSQSDLMSAVSISELSQSVDSISVNDPDLDIAQFGSGLLQPAGAESKMETTLKELNLEIDRAFKREPDDALRVEQSKLFSHIPSSVVSEVLPLENLPLSDAQFSHMITTVPLSNSETDFLQRQTDKTYSAFGLPSEMKQMTTSLSDSCMASDAARMDSDLQHSYHHQSGAAENKQPFFITELASTEFSEDFSQMLKLYAPDEVEKMMAESDDYWAQSGHRSQSHDIFLPQVSVEVPLLSSSLPHLNPIQYLPIQTVKSELPAPVGSRPLCIVPDQHDPPVGTDLNVVIQQNVLERNAGKRKCEILSCKSSSTGSMENIPSKSPRSMSSLNHEDLLTRSAPVGHSQGWLESDLTQDTPTSAPGSMSLPAVSPQKDLVAAVSASLQYHQTSPRTSPEIVMASELPVNVDSWHCQMSSGSYLTAQTENKYTDSAILPSPMFMQWNRENMAPLCEDGTTPLPQLLSSGSYVAEDDPNLIPAPPPSPLTVSMSSDSLHFSQTDSQRQVDNCDTLIPVICETSPAHQELIENRPVLKKSKTDSFLQQAPWNLSSESWLFPTQPLEVVVERQQIVCSQKGNKEGETLNRSQGSMQENQTFLNEVPLPRPTTSSSSSSSSSAAAKLGTHLKEVVNQFGILSECVIKSYSMDSSHPAFYSHSAANQQQPGFSLQQESHAKPFPTVSDGRRKILESWPPRRETIIEIRPTIKDAQKKLCLRTHSARTFSEMGGRRPTEKCGVLSKSMHEVGAQSSDMSTIQVVSSDDVDLVKTRSLDSLLPPVVESKRSGQHSSSRTRVSAGWIAPESPIPHPAHWSESGRTPHIPKLVPSVDAEISDSVFADDEKDNQIINKCIAGVARCFKDSLSNRSSLDESVLQVAAERHHAFDSFNTSIPTDRYNSGSLQKPRKLQNLKEFFEIAEHRNRQLAKFQGSDGKPRKHHSEDNAMQAEPKPITASTGRIFHHRSRSRERGKKNQGRQPASRSPTPSSRKPAALEKWQRAESQEREGKRWDMGVDYVYSKQKVKSESPALSGTAAKPPRYCSSPRARTCSESSTSDGEVMRSPPAQRSVEVRCIGLGLDSSKVVKRFPEQSKNDTSDSECKFLTSDLEGSGDEPLTSNLKRKGSIKELRNFFEGKQQDAVFRESRTDLASSPRKFSRPRVKSLSPVCGQSETKSDDEISHRGNVRFSLDFSRYTSAPHVEGIINKQPVRLGPMPFYGTKT